MWLLLLLCLGLFALSDGFTSERGRLLKREQPQVNPLLDDLEAGNANAKIAALKAKAAASASRARSAAAQASTSQIHVEQIDMQNKMKKADLEDALVIATDAAKQAVQSSKEAVAALGEAKVLAKTAVADAKKLAVAEVKEMLAGKYHQLEEWRSKVLSNPYERAKKAGVAAAAPYYKGIQGLYKRIQDYQMEARNLMGQANAAAGNANSLSGGAQGKMDGGDPIGAKQDVENAKAMQAQGAALSGEANALEGQAQTMNNMIGNYIAAGHMAAWRAEYNADPDSLPPPPADPNRAFTPPPP